MQDTSHTDLIRKAQAGSLPAFESLIKMYDERILALAMQVLKNKQDAEDVYQEAMIKAYTKLHTFRFQSDFFTWLYRITVNTAITYQKKMIRHRHQPLEHENSALPESRTTRTADPLPDRQTLDHELKDKMDAIIDRFPLMQRVVFVLRFFQDFKIKDIAEITGCSEGTIKNYIFRSTQKMKRQLTPYLNG